MQKSINHNMFSSSSLFRTTLIFLFSLNMTKIKVLLYALLINLNSPELLVLSLYIVHSACVHLCVFVCVCMFVCVCVRVFSDLLLDIRILSTCKLLFNAHKVSFLLLPWPWQWPWFWIFQHVRNKTFVFQGYASSVSNVFEFLELFILC